MNRVLPLLSRGYGCLLRLYPAPFRAEFAAEMDEVFFQASRDAASRGWVALAGHCLRELAAWPREMACEWTAVLRTSLAGQIGASTMGSLPVSRPSRLETGGGAPAPWRQTLLATLALLLPGLGLLVWPGLPPSWHLPLAFGSYILILLGLLAGWVSSFPRWSYAYVGHALLFALWLDRVATPGFQLLGHTFSSNEVWGWRAWLGLAAVPVLALLLTRSLRPLGAFFTGIWRDWTRLSLLLYGALPFLMWLLSDELRIVYRVPTLTLSSLLLAAGALAYMRSVTTARRMLSLLSGLSASWLVCSVGMSAYWHGPRVAGRPPFHWSDTAVPMALSGIVVLTILLLPVIPLLLQRVVNSRSTA